jgi:two-component sensor histidine kinase
LPTGLAELVVADDGVGVDPATAPSTGLGSELIRQLIDQIDGTLTVVIESGTRATVRFAG